MSEILANYMIFNARKYTFICVFLMQVFGYCIEIKEEEIILEKTGIVFGLFLCACFRWVFSVLSRNPTKITRNFHILSKP